MPQHPEHTDCHAVEPLIEGYVDGDLGAAERATFEAHLEHCGSCAAEIALARRIRDLTGSRSEIRHLPRVPDDPRRRCPDITLARERLDWEPRVPLDKGLRKTIAAYGIR